MKKIYNVAILGGSDGFGKWLASFAMDRFSKEISITITGNNAQKGQRVARELGVEFSSDNIGVVRGADIVIYCVPISLTQKVIQETLSYIRPGAIVADVTSIKKFPSKFLNQRDDIIVIPTHPMFGPYTSSIAGQVVVLTPNEDIKTRDEFILLKEFLEREQAKVIESTPEYHDKMMAVVQGLTHMNMFVIGETMKRLGFNIADSMDFISPIYKLMVSSVGRYLGQNPGLYADIQMYNDEVGEVHEKFLDTANNFHDCVKNKDYEKFCGDIISAREFLGEENCMEGQQYTDKLIYLLGEQIDILKRNIGKKVGLRDIYSREYIEGKLENYKDGSIFFPQGNIYNIDQYEVVEL